MSEEKGNLPNQRQTEDVNGDQLLIQTAESREGDDYWAPRNSLTGETGPSGTQKIWREPFKKVSSV